MEMNKQLIKNLCDVRNEFEKYNLISGLHTYFGQNENTYYKIFYHLLVF
jgi:4-hydroxy-tetrahydrodipicolinate synthase